MNPKYVLALVLVLAPTVYGCVNFQVQYVSSKAQMIGSFWDNQPVSNPTCQILDVIGSDGLFHMQCGDGYTVTIDYHNNAVNWDVHMTNPSRALTFLATLNLSDGTSTDHMDYNRITYHTACRYDCSPGVKPDCFVPFY